MNLARHRYRPRRNLQPGRWGKRLLYFLAACGGLALAGLLFLVYLSLQAPVERLPLPGLPLGTAAAGRLEPMPLPLETAVDQGAGSASKSSDGSAYAAFYRAKSQEGNPPQAEVLRPRGKGKGRPAAVKKARHSS